MSGGLRLASHSEIKETPLMARDFSPYTNNGGYDIFNSTMALCCAKYLTGPLLHAQERTSVLLGLTLVWARAIPSIQETSPNYVNCMCHLPHLHSLLHIFPLTIHYHISLPLVLCSITAHRIIFVDQLRCLMFIIKGLTNVYLHHPECRLIS